MLDEGTVKVPIGDGGEIVAFSACPADMSTGGAGVIVIHDILGLTRDTRRVTRRLAGAGYHALAPDLYDGLGWKLRCVARTMTALRSGQGPAFDRLEAARDWLVRRPEIDEKRIGVIGFCMGGGFALLFAAKQPLAVAAPFYGDVPEDAEALRDICPVVGGYGGRDRTWAPQGKRLIAHLERLGVEHDVKIYPDAGHSYMNDHRDFPNNLLIKISGFTPMHAGYSESAAEDSWRRVLEFFSRTL